MKGVVCLEEKKWFVKTLNSENYRIFPTSLLTKRLIPGQEVDFELVRYCKIHKQLINKESNCGIDCAWDEEIIAKIKLSETEHLMNSEANEKRLEESILQLKSKPFYAANVRDLLDLYDKEEISLNKFVEELNAIARRFYEK